MVYALLQGNFDDVGPDVQTIRVQGELTEANASRLIVLLDRRAGTAGGRDLLV